MEQTTTRTCFYDSLGITIPDRPELPAPKAAARLRRLLRYLMPRFAGRLAWHDVAELRAPTPRTMHDRDHLPGQPVAMRLPTGWIAAGLLPVLLGELHRIGARVYRLDVALDLDLAAGVQLDLDAMGFDCEHKNTSYRGHTQTDDLAGAAYSDKPSKVVGFAAGRKVQHVEHRLHRREIPLAVRLDPFALLALDPLDLWQTCAHETAIEPVSATLRRVLAALRRRARNGAATIADRELAELAKCPESTARWSISALHTMGFLRIIRRQRGRGHLSVYELQEPTSLWLPAPPAVRSSRVA